MIRVLLIFSLAVLLVSMVSAQTSFKKTGSCQNAKFDQKVNSYLSYSAPVIDVKLAYRDQAKYVFLDARELKEYNVSHIPKARYVGYDNFDKNTIKDVDKTKPIIVYCSIGYRSEKIATKLRKLGYVNVFNLYGSIFEWANLGYPLHNISEAPTVNVHTYNKSWSQWVTNPKIIKQY